MSQSTVRIESPARGGVRRPRSGLQDGLIRAREWALNRLLGATGVINEPAAAAETAPPDPELAARLRETVADLRASVIADGGAAVDYAALRRSPAYTGYRQAHLATLRRFRPDRLAGAAGRRAFWINLYNALVLDAVIAFDVQRSVVEGRLGLLAFFRRAAYLVGGQRVSLEDIEHGILRANRGHPYLPGVHFATGDPRLGWALPLDPRIHFALNCGGRSCPPIRAYTGADLDAQLDLAARGFVSQTVAVQPAQKRVTLSRIFQWYQADFGGREGVLDFVAAALPDDERRRFIRASRGELTLQYRDYDWGLNRL